MSELYRGVHLEQDGRFSNKQTKMLSQMSFPMEYKEKVDMKKVRLDIIQPWIGQKLQEILGFEDDVLYNFICGQLEEQFPDPRTLQVNLTGFLENNTADFVLALWKLLLSAQSNLGGIPAAFLEKKMLEIAQRRSNDDKIRDSLKKEKESQEVKHKNERMTSRHRRSRSRSISPDDSSSRSRSRRGDDSRRSSQKNYSRYEYETRRKDRDEEDSEKRASSRPSFYHSSSTSKSYSQKNKE